MRFFYSAPTERPSKAQANGPGQEVGPIFGSQALKGRDKDHPSSLGDIRPRCQGAISPFQDLQGRRGRVLGPHAGYGEFSVSPAEVDSVAAYIEGQGRTYRKVSFQDEYRRFLKEYGWNTTNATCGIDSGSPLQGWLWWRALLLTQAVGLG